MSKRDKPEEETARAIISRTLHVPVSTHDDGSRPSMYDLSIQLPDGNVGAVEVTMAADREAVQLSRLVNQEKRWIEPMLETAWHVSALPQARGKRLFAELPQLLAELEQRDAPPFISIEDDEGNPDPLMKRAFELRLESVYRSDTTDYPGAIYISVEGRELGGFVPQTGDPVADWIGDFLAGEERADIRTKLSLADTRERHAFVWVPLFHTRTVGGARRPNGQASATANQAAAAAGRDHACLGDEHLGRTKRFALVGGRRLEPVRRRGGARICVTNDVIGTASDGAPSNENLFVVDSRV